jgi:hypothetical protein
MSDYSIDLILPALLVGLKLCAAIKKAAYLFTISPMRPHFFAVFGNGSTFNLLLAIRQSLYLEQQFSF